MWSSLFSLLPSPYHQISRYILSPYEHFHIQFSHPRFLLGGTKVAAANTVEHQQHRHLKINSEEQHTDNKYHFLIHVYVFCELRNTKTFSKEKS